MLEFTKNQGIVREKILSGKSCLKLFIVNCIFASIQVFSRSLFWRSAANQGNVVEFHIVWRVVSLGMTSVWRVVSLRMTSVWRVVSLGMTSVWRVVSLGMTSVCNPQSFKSSVSFLY